MAGPRNIEDTIDSLFGTSDNDDTTTQSASNDQSSDTTSQPAATGGEQDASEQQLEAGKLPGNTNGDGTKPGNGGEAKPAAATPPVSGTKPQEQVPAPRAAKPGDLTDRDGNVIAKAGVERRLYEQNRTLNTQHQQVQQQLQTVSTELKAYKDAATLPRELGLDPSDVTTAMQFMSHWKKNPREAAQNMLADLVAMGHTIDGLGGDTNTAAIKKMIEQGLQPFQQERVQQQQHIEAQQAADREIATVFAENPWAERQQPALMKLMDAAPQLSFRDTVHKLEVWALRNGFDVEQDIEQQIVARQQQAQQPPVAPATPNPARAQAPSGTTGMPQRAASNIPQTGNARTRDIVREAMRANGINVGD